MATSTGDGNDGRGRPAPTGPAHPPARAQRPLDPNSTSGRPTSAPPKHKRASTQTRGPIWAFCLRPLGICVRCIAGVVPILLITGGLFYLKLLSSPLTVPFLVDPITRALNAELHGLNVTVEDAVLLLSPRGGLEFRLKSVRVADAQGVTVAMAAFAGIELSWRAMRSGRIAPARIDLIEPRMLLTHDEQGIISISITEGPKPDAVTTSSPKTSQSTPGPAAAAPDTAPAGTAPIATSTTAVHFDIARSLAQMLARSRQSGEVASHLEAVGLRDASVILDDRGRRQIWKVPEMRLGLAHRQKRSRLTLDATIQSGPEPWTLSMRADEGQKAKTIPLSIKFDRLRPAELAQALPSINSLAGIDTPLGGEAAIELTPDGEILEAKIELAAGAGKVDVLLPDGSPLLIEKAAATLRFDGAARRLEIVAAHMLSGSGALAFAGHVAPAPTGAQKPLLFDLRGTRGSFLKPASGDAIPIDQFRARGGFAGASNAIDLAELVVKAGGAELTMNGRIGDDTALEGRIGAASIEALRAFWPANLAPQHRNRILESLRKGQLKGGAFIVSNSAAGRDRRVSISMEATDLEIELRKGMPLLEVPRALLRVEGASVEVTIPEAAITATANRKVALKGGRITLIGIDQPRPVAEIAGRLQGPLPAVLDILDRGQIGIAKLPSLPLSSIDGKAEAQFKISVPLDDALTLADARIEGKARITDGRIKDIVGTHDISGATMTIDANDKGVELKGDMLLGGVIAKVAGQWFANAPDGRQPPLRITARLDNADRAQLGLDLDELVQGEIPFEVTIQRSVNDEPARVHVIGDLTSATLMLDEVQWRKPVGRPARLEFDVGKGPQGKGIELQNFKISGENIAIEGWVSIGPDNKARAYDFPEFSLNVVTNLEVKGTLRPDRVWDIKATGKTFDGADLFRSLFSFETEAAKPSRKGKPGIDVSADIATVLGPNDTSLKQLTVKAKKRAGQFMALELKGKLDGGAPLTAVLQVNPGQPRVLVVDTPDTGQALKLIGLYSSMIGGKGHIGVNIDSSGAAEKSGKIQIENFKVLGDPIIAEVLQSPDGTQAMRSIAPGGRRTVVREQFDFESFDGAFSIGNSQLVIHRALAKGPLIGASAQGKIDFRAKRMQLGGTYVPLSGLNRLFSQLPLFGPILTGPRGEGVFGITFAVEGSTSDPQVVVNPLSALTPGITRELMQMTPSNPRLTPRAENPVANPEAVPQVRASPPTEARKKSTTTKPRAEPEVSDGWASGTFTTTGKGQKK